MFVFCNALLLSNLTRCKCVNGTSSRYHFSFAFTDITTFLSFIYFDLCCLYLYRCLCLLASIYFISHSLTTLPNPIIPPSQHSLAFLLFSQCLLLCKLFDGLKGFNQDSGASQSNVKNYCIRFAL